MSWSSQWSLSFWLSHQYYKRKCVSSIGTFYNYTHIVFIYRARLVHNIRKLLNYVEDPENNVLYFVKLALLFN
jgi:hypothetical protein